MGAVWSIGIFAENATFDLRTDQLSRQVHVFNARALRRSKRHPHTYADPFVFCFEDVLYLFAEIQEVGAKGYINVWRTTDLRYWKNLGPILKGSHHYSYPHIIQTGPREVYMLPQTDSGEIALYHFSAFPRELERVQTILTGRYADTSIIHWQDVFYLSTRNQETRKLELYFSDELLAPNWQRHPCSPITDDPMIGRNGGGFTVVRGSLLRIAQDNRVRYGGGIVLFAVTALNKVSYREHVLVPDYRASVNHRWHRLGRHHLSITEFRNNVIVAMDGMQTDYAANKIINMAFRMLQSGDVAHQSALGLN